MTPRPQAPKLKYLVAALLVPFVVFGAYTLYERWATPLPVFSEPLYEATDLKDVKLYNQHGELEAIGQTWKGQVVLVNFFFTHCVNICPPMMHNLKTMVAPRLEGAKGVRMASVSVDYRRDSVARLQEYAAQMGIDKFPHWYLYTSPDKRTHLLARNVFKTAISEVDSGMNFIHSGLIILLDQQGRMRGFFDSNDPQAMEKLVKATRKLI